MNGAEHRARHFLDNWKLWVGVAYFGLAATVVALFFINQNTQRALSNQTKAETAHTAEILASADSLYAACISSRPVLQRINGFVAGVNTVEATLIANSALTLRRTAKSSPMYPIRAQNLHRLRVASRYSQTVHFPVPSRASCKAQQRRILNGP